LAKGLSVVENANSSSATFFDEEFVSKSAVKDGSNPKHSVTDVAMVGKGETSYARRRLAAAEFGFNFLA
jgi:hypothetical protein